MLLIFYRYKKQRASGMILPSHDLSMHVALGQQAENSLGVLQDESPAKFHVDNHYMMLKLRLDRLTAGLIGLEAPIVELDPPLDGMKPLRVSLIRSVAFAVIGR
jgi:hypothetical protein